MPDLESDVTLLRLIREDAESEPMCKCSGHGYIRVSVCSVALVSCSIFFAFFLFCRLTTNLPRSS